MPSLRRPLLAAILALGPLTMPAHAEPKVIRSQVDLYTSTKTSALAFNAGGSLSYGAADLGDFFHSENPMPLYVRAGLSIARDTNRFTLGPELATPWIMFFRGLGGAGVEVKNQANLLYAAPYIRLGGQMWIFFSELDVSFNMVRSTANPTGNPQPEVLSTNGLRFEF